MSIISYSFQHYNPHPIKDHIIYDAWDSVNKSVYSYYIKSEIKGGKS